MTLEEYKAKKMKDPEFARAYKEIQPEIDIVRAVVDCSTSQNFTQKNPSKKNTQ